MNIIDEKQRKLRQFGVPELSGKRRRSVQDKPVMGLKQPFQHYLWDESPVLQADPNREKKSVQMMELEKKYRRTEYKEKIDIQKRYADVELVKMRRPKILMLSATSPFGHYKFQVDVTNPFKKLYCKRWWISYAYIEYNRSPLGRHPFWDRIYYIRKYLDSYDYIWWLDADAAPVEIGVDVYERHINGRSWDILIGNETLNTELEGLYFNTGCMLFKNNIKVKRFLAEWESQWLYEKFRDNDCPEQDAFNYLYQRGNSKNAIRIEYESVGRLQDWGRGFEKSNWVPGCLVHHTPMHGRPGARKSGWRFRELFWEGLNQNVLSDEGLFK